MSESVSPGHTAHSKMVMFFFLNGWSPKPLKEQRGVWMYFDGDEVQAICYAHVERELERFLFYVVAPVQVPQSKRPEVAEFLNRVNFKQRIGNFEMNLDNGEVRYKSSVNFKGVPLTPSLIKYPAYMSAMTMDRYWPGVVRVMDGKQSAAEAAATIDKGE